MQEFTTQLVALSGEYLFFIGATYIAVLLLSQQRWVWATLAFATATFWLTFHLPVTLYLESLGVDSFAEAQQFNWDEARFWLRTLGETIYPDFSTKKFIAYLIIALGSFYALKWLFNQHELTRRSYVAAKYALSLAFIGLAFHHTASRAIAFYLENSEAFVTTAKNFTHEPPAVATSQNKTSLLVYVGESTSTMNMSLYGYPRPTTPLLSHLARHDPQLLVFDHVFATHAHTSRSLLEALSFGLDPDERFLPITRRHQLSVVDVLKKAGMAPRLVSNQGVGGSWDQASSVIFKHSDNVFRARLAQQIGAQAAMPALWDDEFFEPEIQAFAVQPQRGALFLHSYAGHGPYLGNIPPAFHRPVDEQLDRLQPQQILMDTSQAKLTAQAISLVQAYDAAIRYVDFSVAKAISLVKYSKQPIILVYFSDHGDAAFAGRGHDSARFKHEMARVPFLLYFNDAAAQANAGLLKKYRGLARTGETATLAQLPSTLLDLLGLRIQPGSHPLLSTALIGEKTALPPIMVRETAEGMTYVNLNPAPLPLPTTFSHTFIDKTDEDTLRYVAARAAGRDAHTAKDKRVACISSEASLEAFSRSLMLGVCRRSAVAD